MQGPETVAGASQEADTDDSDDRMERIIAIRVSRLDSCVDVLTSEDKFKGTLESLAKGLDEYLTAFCSDSRAKTKLARQLNRWVLTVRGIILSAKYREAIQKILYPSFENIPILLEGEPGVGKQFLALSIHQSQDQPGTFTVIDCGGVNPYAKLEEAYNRKDRNGVESPVSTIFLKDIQCLKLSTQRELLQLIESGFRSCNDISDGDSSRHALNPTASDHERKLSMRIIASGDGTIAKQVREGTFYKELYDQLSITHTILPTLREQLDDIVAIFQWFAELPQAGLFMPSGPTLILNPEHKYTYAIDVEEALRSHPWPGNLIELKSCAINVSMMANKCNGEIKGDMIKSCYQPVIPSGIVIQETPDEQDIVWRELIDHKWKGKFEADYPEYRRITMSRGYYEDLISRDCTDLLDLVGEKGIAPPRTHLKNN
jgi:DNA-binding NtrC family response regulator